MADAIVAPAARPRGQRRDRRRARPFVEARFDWDGIAARLVTTYEAALGTRAHAAAAER